MRNIVNISLPKKMVVYVKKEARRRRYSSVSEFIRGLIRADEEEKILEIVRQGRKEYKTGKAKVLRSLKDLR